MQITEISPDSPAKKAGLQLGDAILQIEADDLKIKIDKIETVQKIINEYRGKTVTINILRDGKETSFSLIPRVEPPKGEGALGIGMTETGIVFYPWHKSIWHGIKITLVMLASILILFLKLIKDLIFTGTSEILQGLAGPVGIAVMTGQAVKFGLAYLIQFAAFLSINLAIINALPFPALDGGRLLFLGIEKIKGSPVSSNIEKIIHTAGFAFLIALMILITVRDVGRFF